MSKEAICFCIDVSASMGKTDPGKSQARLAEALEGVKLLIEAKILQTKQNEIGVVLFGTEGTDNPLSVNGGYEHVTLLASVERPALALTSVLDTVQIGEESADLIDGLVVAVDVLHRRVGTKKYTKTIYLITAAEDPIENPADLEATVQHMVQQDFTLVVVGINFANTFDHSLSGVKVESNNNNNDDDDAGLDESSSVKAQNEKMLCSIARATPRGIVMSSNDLVAAMSALQNKAVRPMRNKCVLLLPSGSSGVSSSSSSIPGSGGGVDNASSSYAIDVVTFARSKRQSAPTLKKESKSAYDPSDPQTGSGAVSTLRTYRNPLHPDEEVLPQDLVKGFRYGKDYVPVSSADLGGMKVESERAYLQLLGFASASSIKLSDSIGDTKCMCAADSSVRSEAALGSLHAALATSKRVAIGRFVARKNADPQLVCLSPDPQTPVTVGQARLLMWQLPFSDDQRGFTFPSFDKAPKSQRASDEQRACAASVVESMMLDGACLKPELTFNPFNQRLRNTIIARVKDPACQLPGVDARVRAYMDPSPALLEQAKPALESFAKLFPFAPVESASTGKRKAHFWSDIAGGEGAASGDTSGAAAVAGGESGAAASKAAKGAAALSVGSVDPVGDFEAMMSAVGSPDVVSTAITQMMARVEEFILEGATTAYYKKAVSCVVALRVACLAHGESNAYNAFLKERFKLPFESGRHGEVWELLVASGTSLINRDEDSAVEDINAAAAKAFLAEDIAAAASQTQAGPAAALGDAGSDDDMFGDME